MTYLKTSLVLLLVFSLFQGCNRNDSDDCVDCHNDDGETLGTISISVEEMELASDQQILVVLSKNNDRINHAQIDHDGERASIVKYDSLKTEGDFIEAYYTDPGSVFIDIDIEVGEYYAHIFGPDGKKAVEYFALTDKRPKDERFTQLFDIGHMIIQVGTSPITGSEVEGALVHVYDYSEENFQKVQINYLPEPEIEPTYAATTGTAYVLLEGKIQGRAGIAFFYNIPITSYIVKADLFPFTRKGGANYSTTIVKPIHNNVKVFRISFSG